jgi:hypothetical protein
MEEGIPGAFSLVYEMGPDKSLTEGEGRKQRAKAEEGKAIKQR